MGLVSRLFGSKKQAQQVAILGGNGSYELQVVGESHYQKALEKITGGKTKDGHEMEVEAMLIHDDKNPYDNQAVAVKINGELVGYLSRDLARQFRKQMAASGYQNKPALCKALIVGGWNRGGGDEGHFGVRLDLPLI